jgi:Subtilase family
MLILDLGDPYWLSGRPVDPYLRWAILTDFRNFRRVDKAMGVSHLSFIVERKAQSKDWDDLHHFDERIRIPEIYRTRSLANGKLSTFATLRINIRGLDSAPVKDLILKVLEHPDVVRIQLGYPRGQDGSDSPNGPGQDPIGVRIKKSVVLGIVDDGCPFAHPDLCDVEGNARIAVLWQQTVLDKPEQRWRKPVGFDHGRVLDADAMNKFIAEARVRGDVDELRCYQDAFATDELGYRKANRALLTRASHGGSVMAIAAGTPSNLGGCVYGKAGDAASKAPLIFVDLPREQVEISSGRWISINALDGLRFILREARHRYVHPKGGEVPVVVNISSGSTAGAHRGQAMLERAMDEVLNADPRVAVTLAAGNSRNQESHAQFDVAAGGSATLGVFVPAIQRFDTHVELWLPPMQDQSQVAVCVTAADGEEMMVWADRREDFIYQGDGVSAALLFYPKVVQAGKADWTMVLLAVSATAKSGTRRTEQWPYSAAGPWRLTVHNAGTAKVALEAWIERDEVVFGTRRDQMARFFTPDDEGPGDDGGMVSRVNTMSNISTGQTVFPVAAYRGPTDGGPLAEYSGAPPAAWAAQKRYLPFAARADTGKAHPGVRVPGNRGNVMRRMNGTSVAAPQAARYVANAMAEVQKRAEVEKSLPEHPKPLPRPGKPSKVDPADGRKRL